MRLIQLIDGVLCVLCTLQLQIRPTDSTLLHLLGGFGIFTLITQGAFLAYGALKHNDKEAP